MKKPTIHLICNAHLDPVWQWQWEEGCSEALSTFRTAITLLGEYPELIFNHNEAVLYEWVKEHDPVLFGEIKEMVRQNRWFISGGWYLQPDVNLPDTESLIRHILYGREFFRTHFNAEPVVAYNFDSFGHSGGLPQILRKAGYKMYVHMRPQADDLELPDDLYLWEGVDGTQIPAYRIAVGLYHTEYGNLEERLQQGVELALAKNRDIALFWGIGDHGGGATREDLELIRRFVAAEPRVELVHSTTDRFYQSVEPYIAGAPVHKGDLQRVFTGCYTSLSRVKRASISNAAMARKAEALATAAWWCGAAAYPFERMKNAWLQHLFNDFHDILPGTCIEPAEKDTLDIYGSSNQEFRAVLLHSAYAFNRLQAFREAYLPVTVVNSNPTLDEVPLEFECMFGYRPPWHGKWRLRMFDSEGSEVTIQEEQPEALLPFHQWRRKISFFAKVPFGVGNFYLKPEEITGETLGVLTQSRYAAPDRETGLLGDLAGTANRKLLASALLAPVVVNDTGDSWGTGCKEYSHFAGYFRHEKQKFSTIEQGPIRQIDESQFVYRNSKAVYHTIRYAAFDALEFRIRLYWNEPAKRVQLETGFSFAKPELLVEVPGGAIQRPADGQEHVHGRWLLVSDNGDPECDAIGIVNSGQAGIAFAGNRLFISVLRSAAYCHEQGFQIGEVPHRKFMDQGVHNIRMLVVTGKRGQLLQKMAAYAEFLNGRPVVFSHLPVGSRTPAAKAPFGIELQPANIRLLALKPTENGGHLVIRLQETSGLGTQAAISLSYPEISLTVNFQPFAIKTLLIDRKGNARETNLTEAYSLPG